MSPLSFRTKTGSWDLPPTQLDRWQHDYPAVDVAQECRKALHWVDANPTRRKTARGMLKFLVAWLNRASPSRPPQRAICTWREHCRQLGHEPLCNNSAAHELRQLVAAEGCTHPGVCQSFGQHAQRLADETKAVAS